MWWFAQPTPSSDAHTITPSSPHHTPADPTLQPEDNDLNTIRSGEVEAKVDNISHDLAETRKKQEIRSAEVCRKVRLGVCQPVHSLAVSRCLQILECDLTQNRAAREARHRAKAAKRPAAQQKRPAAAKPGANPLTAFLE